MPRFGDDGGDVFRGRNVEMRVLPLGSAASVIFFPAILTSSGILLPMGNLITLGVCRSMWRTRRRKREAVFSRNTASYKVPILWLRRHWPCRSDRPTIMAPSLPCFHHALPTVVGDDGCGMPSFISFPMAGDVIRPRGRSGPRPAKRGFFFPARVGRGLPQSSALSPNVPALPPQCVSTPPLAGIRAAPCRPIAWLAAMSSACMRCASSIRDCLICAMGFPLRKFEFVAHAAERLDAAVNLFLGDPPHARQIRTSSAGSPWRRSNNP